MSTDTASGTADNPVVTANISPMAGRLDQALPVGNEGAGVVVQAGTSPAAQALMGEPRALGRRGAGPSRTTVRLSTLPPKDSTYPVD